jgi:CBS domain-containing protein
MRPKIREVMSRNVECTSPDTTIRQAASLMKQRDIGSLPVCLGRTLVGLVTDRDLTVRATAAGRDPNRTKVGEVMSREIISARQSDTLEDAERLMHDRQLPRLPIVDDQGTLVGYLAMAQVARIESPDRAGKLLEGVSQKKSAKPMR